MDEERAEERSPEDAVPVVLAPEWDDRMWEDVWERTIGQAERHRVVMLMLRHEEPRDVLARRLVPELARRWRRTCLTLAAWWGGTSAFWLVIAIGARADGDGIALGGVYLAVPGVLVSMVALAVWAWVRDVGRT